MTEADTRSYFGRLPENWVCSRVEHPKIRTGYGRIRGAVGIIRAVTFGYSGSPHDMGSKSRNTSPCASVRKLARPRCSRYVHGSRSSNPSSQSSPTCPRRSSSPRKPARQKTSAPLLDLATEISFRPRAICSTCSNLRMLCRRWKRWSSILLRPEGLYGTRPAEGGNKGR